VAKSDLTIAGALLDQRNLAGVGTLYASETLFLARLNPWTAAAALTDVEVNALVDRAHRLLDANRHHAFQSTTGLRRHGQTTYVHGRSGLICRRCGTTIRAGVIGGPPRERTFFYCPTCQRKDTEKPPSVT
jgi:endonuclease-8